LQAYNVNKRIQIRTLNFLRGSVHLHKKCGSGSYSSSLLKLQISHN
jgi:hypothetical protein